LRTGGASEGDVALVTAPEGELMTGIACLNVDEDDEEELAFATVAVDGLGTRVYATSPPFDAPPRLMVDLHVSSSALVFLGPVGLTAGDVTGDGVDDLVLPTPTTMHVLRALPHRP
jgi:hypothetical protein